jgi:AcrR family transcriptional regulator
VTAAVGRRPGRGDTRGDIVAAARQVFAADGYARASLRAIARLAGVDAALVHHYFADRSALFVAAMDIPVDPHEVQHDAMEGGFDGERLVERFLAQWERGPGPGSASFVALAQAMATSPPVAAAMREFLAERITLHGRPGEGEEVARCRRALVSSQLLGLAWTRYVMRIEPMASASPRQVARWAGPTIERYARGDVALGDVQPGPTPPPAAPGPRPARARRGAAGQH